MHRPVGNRPMFKNRFVLICTNGICAMFRVLKLINLYIIKFPLVPTTFFRYVFLRKLSLLRLYFIFLLFAVSVFVYTFNIILFITLISLTTLL